MKEFGLEFIFGQNDSCENFDNFPLIRLLYMNKWCLHGPISFLPQLWMEQFDTLPIQFRHIEQMHEEV